MKKILVVDDTKENIDMLVNIFRDYDVLVALSGEKAIKILEKESVDLILLDIIMPNLDGFETCLTIKSREDTKNIPIIFMTARTDDEAIERAYDVGGVDYVTKPFQPKEILSRVSNHISLNEYTNSLVRRVEDGIKEIRVKDQQMIQQSRLAQMGEMISMIAHQWRQPLHAITMTSSSIQVKAMRNKLENQFLMEKTELINEYAQYLSKTVDDFRNFFKEEKEKSKTTISQIVEGTLHIVEASIANKEIPIEKVIDCDTEFETFVNGIKQVLLNLIKNSEDTLLEKEIDEPKITIETECNKNHIFIRVKDNGGGVPEEIVDKIFDPYFSTKLNEDGTGLGLYMSKTIVEKHCKGLLSLKNIDSGAIFEIKLPISEEQRS
jgi:C4-dicarboxylate-specific signal transduction histidine kinase